MKWNNSLKKLQYNFDNMMSKGPIAMTWFLGVLSLLLIIIAGFVYWAFKLTQDDSKPLCLIESFWQSLMRTLFPNLIASDTDWTYRLVSIFVAIGGIFILSTLIGILSSAINNKIVELQKGKSFIIEKNHTLILGWSSKIVTIISELIIANENVKNARIVILADMDKVEMDDNIRAKITNFKKTKVICRSGSPTSISDIEIVNPNDSKSIIILPPDKEKSDSTTIKTILAITNNLNRRKEPFHIITEIKDDKNIEVVKFAGGNEVEVISTDEIIGKIIVQTSRQSGLSMVYTELMDFDGEEIYFNEEKTLVGKTYLQSLFSYNNSAVIGIQYANGKIEINPKPNCLIQKGDKIIAITEDDDTLIISENSKIEIQEDSIQNINNFDVKKREEYLCLAVMTEHL